MQRHAVKTGFSALSFGVALAALAVVPAQSATLDFQIDPILTVVEITNQSGGGLACTFTSCGISAQIAPGLPTAGFQLGVGQTNSFDFITWTADGSTGFSARQFNVTATLAFNLPLGTSVSSGGNGAAFFISGIFTGGVLNWNNVPTSVALTDGSVISINFEDGLTILPLVGAITTHATVTVDFIAPQNAPVPTPLPLAAPLFGAGLGVLGFMSWRRKRRQRGPACA
jgi:hypothetical protein